MWQEMKRSTDQATRAADAAENTIKYTRESFQSDQRAWVGVKSIQIDGKIEKGSKLQAFIEMHNSGKTPAIEVAIGKSHGAKYPTKQILSSPIKEAKLAIPPTVGFTNIQV